MISMEMMTCEYRFSFILMLKFCHCKIRSCWIKTDDGAIWGFVAPILVIILV